MLRRCAQSAVVCASLLLAALAGVTPAGARGTSKHAAFILDANTGAVLHQDDADEQRHPASLTKMMTLYLTFETLEQGRMSMASKVTISQEAASAAPSKLDLEPGEQLTVREAILALITKSANDVAVALAEKIGGNQQNFVRLMNAKARELGMNKTHFENASGLPDPDQITTARDMVTLGLRLQDDFPQHYPMFATRSFTYAGASHRNHNTLMNNFAGIDGIKTGYTRASGFNLVSSVRRSGRHVVGAVFGGSSAASRNAEMRVLLTRALTRASTVKTRKPQPALIAKLKSEPRRAERPGKARPVEVAQAEVPPPPVPKPAKPPAPAAKPKAIAEKPKARATAEPQAELAAPGPRTAPPAPAEVEVAEAQPAPGPPASAPIALTKVKRVMVAPRQGPKRPAPGPAETTDMEAVEGLDTTAGLPEVSETIVAKTSRTSGTVLADASESKASMLGAADVAAAQAQVEAAAPVAAPVAVVDPIQTSPSSVAAAALEKPKAEIAKPIAALALAKPVPAKAQAPAKLPPKIITASTTPAPAAQTAKPTPAAAKTEPAPAAMVQRGMPPSSLAAQAQALKSGGGSNRVASLTPMAGPGRFEIQIGAYNSVAEAQRALDAVLARAGSVIANHASVTQPVDKGGRQIFRARFRGFDANTAARACGALRQQSFDCFVMTAE